MRKLSGFEGQSAVEYLRGNKTKLCEALKGNLAFNQGSDQGPKP